MVSIIVGFILIGFTVFALLPCCLNWSAEVIMFLKGAAPVLSALIGLVALFVGIADLIDKQEAKREEEASKALE